MTDDRTSFLDLPLPHEDNDLDVDVFRLRSAFTSLDGALESLSADVAALTAAVPADLGDQMSALSGSIASLQSAVSAARTDIDAHDAAIIDLLGMRGAANGLAELDANSLVPVSRIPVLDAAKVGTGTFDVARIPALDASKTTTGVFPIARIPDMAASKVTSGTFAAARIPALPTSHISGLDAALASKFPTAGGTINGNLAVTGWISANGDITAFSDRRLKTKIATVEGGLEKVLAMRGVTYERDGVRRLGVIAQEVQEVVPEAVVDNGQYLSVAYGNLVGVLIEAVKELNDKIDRALPEAA